MIEVQRFKPTRVSTLRCLLLVLIVVAIYLLENVPVFSFNRSTLFIYTIKPLLWLPVLPVVYFFPRIRYWGKLRLVENVKWWAGYMAAAYILLMFCGGLIYGFGKSPYDLSPKGILKNILIAFLPLVCREFIRSYLVNSLKGKRILITIFIIAVFYTFIGIPWSKLNYMGTWGEMLEYLGGTVLSEFAKNIMAGYLVYLGGAQLSIIYLGLIMAFNWLSPILPNLNWIAKAFIGTLCPAFSLMILEHIYSTQLKLNKRSTDKENPLGWIATISVSLGLIWFVGGVFPVYPSVIVTGSMKPMINPGDVVLVRKTKGSEVKQNDVIQYKSGDIYIFHRIIDVNKDKGQLKFQAKGDNNSSPDRELVDPGQIKGKVIKVIPKIGWPTIWLKDRKNIEKSRVEF